MEFVDIAMKAKGRAIAAVDGSNPIVTFKGVNLKQLPKVPELLEVCGEKAALYLARGFNNAAYLEASDPYDRYIPDAFDDDQYKAMRTALVQMVKLTGKSIEEVAGRLLTAMGIEG